MRATPLKALDLRQFRSLVIFLLIVRSVYGQDNNLHQGNGHYSEITNSIWNSLCLFRPANSLLEVFPFVPRQH